MSGPYAATADAVMGTIRGTQDAQRLVYTIRQGCAPADALFEGIAKVQQTGDDARVRGFVRELQKCLERAA